MEIGRDINNCIKHQFIDRSRKPARTPNSSLPTEKLPKREIKEYKFSDTTVMERFKAANAERDKLSKNLVIMQALESLMGLPAAYEKQIEAANKGLEESLNWTMLQSQFFRVGDAYVRMYTNHLGKTERQVLPAYPYFKLPPAL